MNSEHFRQKLSSQNLRNDLSGRQDSSVIKKYPDFTYSKGWTVCLQFRQIISVSVLYFGAVLTCDHKRTYRMVSIALSLSTVFIIDMKITGSHYFKRAEVTMAAANKLRPIVLSRFVLM